MYCVWNCGRKREGRRGEAREKRQPACACVHTHAHIHTLRGEGEREKGEVSKYCFVP